MIHSKSVLGDIWWERMAGPIQEDEWQVRCCDTNHLAQERKSEIKNIEIQCEGAVGSLPGVRFLWVYYGIFYFQVLFSRSGAEVVLWPVIGNVRFDNF